jgi:hypothetical protein
MACVDGDLGTPSPTGGAVFLTAVAVESACLAALVCCCIAKCSINYSSNHCYDSIVGIGACVLHHHVRRSEWSRVCTPELTSCEQHARVRKHRHTHVPVHSLRTGTDRTRTAGAARLLHNFCADPNHRNKTCNVDYVHGTNVCACAIHK